MTVSSPIGCNWSVCHLHNIPESSCIEYVSIVQQLLVIIALLVGSSLPSLVDLYIAPLNENVCHGQSAVVTVTEIPLRCDLDGSSQAEYKWVFLGTVH